MARQRTGSIFQRGENWYARIFLKDSRRKDVAVPPRKDGKPITKSYAKRFAQALSLDYEAGRYDPFAPPPPPKDGPPTVYAYARHWVERQTYGTIADDKGRLKRYLGRSVLGGMRITEVKPRHVVDFIKWLGTYPSEKGGTLAPRTIRTVYSILHRVLQSAVLDEYLLAVPQIPHGTLPGIRDKDPAAREDWIFERPEVETLISDPLIPWDRRVEYAIKFLTGCRHGEFAALRWRDYDPTRTPLGGLSITKSVERATRKEKCPKTGVGRKVPVHPLLAAILAEWKLEGWAENYGRPPRPEDFIAPALPKGTIYNRVHRTTRHTIDPEEVLKPRRVWVSWEMLMRDLKRLGFRDNRRQHDTRSTLISLAIADGADANILKWITHGSMRGIMDVYSRLPWETLCREMAKLKIERRVSNVISLPGV